MTRPRLTVRARLTLLYSGLFAVCAAIVVAVSYTLVAQQGPQSIRQPPPAFAAQCRAEQLSAHPNLVFLSKCNAYNQYLGAVQQLHLTLSHLVRSSLITLAVVIPLAAILGWIAAGRALRPVHQITATARAASEHNLSARVAPKGPRDELRELAETFDDMLGRLQAAFEGQQRFIANASHELRTPLAVMGATIDVVLGDPASTPGDLRAMAADIRAAVDHAEHLIGALLILARNERGLTVREEVDLATAAEDVLDATGLGDRQVHATLEAAVISGDPVLAERLIANLVDNAVRYNHDAGDIWISTRTVAGSSQLIVANTGPVISPADAAGIFQPFERLSDRTSRDGFGLGLAIVASIAAIHGGTATARPRGDGGLRVTVMIPAAGAPDQRAGQQGSERPGIRRRILGLNITGGLVRATGGFLQTITFSPCREPTYGVFLDAEPSADHNIGSPVLADNHIEIFIESGCSATFNRDHATVERHRTLAAAMPHENPDHLCARQSGVTPRWIFMPRKPAAAGRRRSGPGSRGETRQQASG